MGIISGEVTFIAAYHYLRIFNSWVESYEYKPNSSGEVENPVLTGVPFNDAYRYMDWLLTVPLLLIEIVFVMSDSQFGLVYNILSFSLASMMSTTIFLWMRVPAVKDCYASALLPQ